MYVCMYVYVYNASGSERGWEAVRSRQNMKNVGGLAGSERDGELATAWMQGKRMPSKVACMLCVCVRVGVCVCVSLCACVRACVRACMHACMRAGCICLCMSVCVCVCLPLSQRACVRACRMHACLSYNSVGDVHAGDNGALRT